MDPPALESGRIKRIKAVNQQSNLEISFGSSKALCHGKNPNACPSFIGSIHRFLRVIVSDLHSARFTNGGNVLIG